MTQSDANEDLTPSARITARIAALGNWRGDTLARIRALFHEADPDVVEEWKWMGTPVWSHGGILCTGESYKDEGEADLRQGRVAAGPGRRVQPVRRVSHPPTERSDAPRQTTSGLWRTDLQTDSIWIGAKSGGCKTRPTGLIREAIACNSAMKPKRAKKPKH